MTKQEKQIIDTYNKHYGRTLFDCYSTPSSEKQRTYKQIYNTMLSKNGYGLTVLTYNTYMYTCAYIIDNVDGSMTLVYHTSSKCIEIDY